MATEGASNGVIAVVQVEVAGKHLIDAENRVRDALTRAGITFFVRGSRVIKEAKK